MRLSKIDNNIQLKIFVSIPLVIVLYSIISLYGFVGDVSVILQKPHSLKTPIDDWIPFVGWFIFPYLLIMPLYPIWTLLLGLSKRITTNTLVALYITYILLNLSCYLIYLVLPTSVESIMIDPAILASSHPILGELMSMLYAIGSKYNAFPSYHVAPMVFIGLFLFHSWRKIFWMLLPFLIATSIATVFVKYHFFVDILGGIVMGIFAYYILYEKIVLKKMNQ